MSSRPAYSLIFAFLVMTIIMLIATTTVENTQEKLVYSRGIENRVQAKLSAESAAEHGVDAIKDFGPGYESSQTESFCLDSDGDANCESWGDYTVYSEGQENNSGSATFSGMYFTPIPGTGSAGNSDDCSIQNELVDPDHPCNWNKLLYGESVSIPLYDTDDTSGENLPPNDLGFNEWYLRIRTPCSDGTMSESCSRYVMDEEGVTSDGYTLIGGDTVVFWQLVGLDETGATVSLVPEDANITYGRGLYERVEDINNEIYEALINEGYDTTGDYIVLEASNTDPYIEIYQICTETHSDYPNPLSSLNLQLNIVHPLIDSSGGSIPYLEWQLVSDSTEPFADTKAVVFGQGYAQSSKGILYFPFVLTRSTTGESTSIYTLSN